MNTIKVEYVGNKPFCIDNVAKSGKTWAGKGDIQEVTPQQAKVLTGYPDQWALVDAVDATKLDEPIVIDTLDAKNEVVKVSVADLGGHVEKMGTSELVAYAMHKYGKKLKASRGRKVVLDEVMALAGTVNPLN